MRRDLSVSLVAAVSLYFLYPVLLGYCSIPVTGFFLPGLLAASFILPFGGLYGFLVRSSKHRLFLIVLTVLPILSLLTAASPQSDLFVKLLFDIGIASAVFMIAAVVGAMRTRVA